MAQSNVAITVARQVLWTFRDTSEESADRDFFASLESLVTNELALRFRNNVKVWVGREVRIHVGNYTVQARLTNIEPLLANTANNTTEIIAQYRVRADSERQDVSTFIAEIIRYPDERFAVTFNALVGIDTIKKDFTRKLNLLLQPDFLGTWLDNHYGSNQPQALAQVLQDRYPLIILEGDVGSGKTALARSVGDRVASNLRTEIVLYIINAQIRGSGHVGELTQNISLTFNEAERSSEREQIPVIIFIDEADALAQSRGGSQTHHEDDAGVNTLIQRIDRLRGKPMAVIFATNLVQSLDSAIVRRAIATYHFDRPDDDQRAEMFRRILANLEVSQLDINQLIELTKPRIIPGFGARTHRYTYSDLSQRIIPQAVEEAIYKQKPLSRELLVNACQKTLPTPEKAVALN